MQKDRSLVNLKNIAQVIFFSLLSLVVFQTIAIGSDFSAVWGIQFLSVIEKLKATTSLYLNPLSYGHIFNWIVTIVASVLIGMQITLHLYIRKNRKAVMTQKTKSYTSVGFISGLFVSLGMGCAACGSLVLLSVFSALGMGLSASMTLWVGDVLLMMACILLIYTNIRLLRQARNPLVCVI